MPERVSPEVLLFWTTPVTLAPMTALMSDAPLPLPELVMVPMLLTLVPEKVMPLASALLLLSTRLPVPLTPPETVSTEPPLLLVKVLLLAPTVTRPLTVKAEVVLFSMISVTFVFTAALMSDEPLPLPELVIVPMFFTPSKRVMPPAIALLLLSTRLPVPLTSPVTLNRELPLALLLMRVVPPLFTITSPLIVKAEVALFSMMAVTFVPTSPLILVKPLPVPELVIVPVLFTSFVSLMPLSIALLLLNTRLPVPVTAATMVSCASPLALLLVKVLLLAPTVTGPLTVKAEVVLFSVIPVTFVSTAALIVVVPLLVPMLVTVPVLLIAPVDSVIVLAPVLVLLIVRLLVPVTPPLKVNAAMLPLLPIVSRPVVVEASAIAFAYVRPVVLTNRVAALLPPALSPSVIVPVPKAFAAVDVPRTVPALMVNPPVNVLAPERVSVPVPILFMAPPVPEITPA